jgi:hypothetical protein
MPGNTAGERINPNHANWQSENDVRLWETS